MMMKKLICTFTFIFTSSFSLGSENLIADNKGIDFLSATSNALSNFTLDQNGALGTNVLASPVQIDPFNEIDSYEYSSCPVPDIVDTSDINNLIDNISQNLCAVSNEGISDPTEKTEFCACISAKNEPRHIRYNANHNADEENDKLRSALVGVSAAKAVARYLQDAQMFQNLDELGIYRKKSNGFCSPEGVKKFYQQLKTNTSCNVENENFESAALGFGDFALGGRDGIAFSKLKSFQEFIENTHAYSSSKVSYLEKLGLNSFENAEQKFRSYLRDKDSNNIDKNKYSKEDIVIFENFAKLITKLDEASIRNLIGRSSSSNISNVEILFDKGLPITELAKDVYSNKIDECERAFEKTITSPI